MVHVCDHLQDVFSRDCDRVQLCRICGIVLHNCHPFQIYDDREQDGGLLPRNHLDDHMRDHREGYLHVHDLMVHDNVDDDDFHVHDDYRNHVRNEFLRGHLIAQELLLTL